MGKRVWIEGGREGRRGRERWSGVGGCGGRKEGRKKGRKVNVYEALRLKEEGERSSSWREGRAGQGKADSAIYSLLVYSTLRTCLFYSLSHSLPTLLSSLSSSLSSPCSSLQLWFLKTSREAI